MWSTKQGPAVLRHSQLLLLLSFQRIGCAPPSRGLRWQEAAEEVALSVKVHARLRIQGVKAKLIIGRFRDGPSPFHTLLKHQSFGIVSMMHGTDVIFSIRRTREDTIIDFIAVCPDLKPKFED